MLAVAFFACGGVSPAFGQAVDEPEIEYMAPPPLPGGPNAPGAQRVFPKPQYYFPFAAYYEGQYATALQQFEESRRTTRKVPGPWLDAIPHHAMLGECYYQMGRLDDALNEYTTAINVVLAYPNWLDRVRFADDIRPAPASRYVKTPWGRSRREFTLGLFSASTSYQEGEVDNTQPVVQGGVVRAPQYLSLNIYEITRGICLALRRRGELLGPLGAYDPLHQQFIEQYLQNPRSGWPRFLLETPLGFAYRAAGRGPQAQAALERCVSTEGFDHPLTGMVLLELGQLTRESGQYDEAARYYDEATFAAAQYEDVETIETAFVELVALQRALQDKRDLPPLETAAAWGGAREFRKLRTMLLIAAAECQANAGYTDAAAGLLSQADQLIGRRDLRTSRGGARFHAVQALVRYQQNEVENGDAVLKNAIAWQRRGSPRQFQLRLMPRLLGSEELTARNALTIYASLLNEPTAEAWVRDPLDAITHSATPQQAAFEQWFLLARNRARKEEESLLLEIADRARRHRFLATLDLGGRPQGLAWLQMADPAMLTPELRLQREDLLLRFPEYAQMRQQAGPLRDAFVALAGADENQRRREHLELLDQLHDQMAAEKRMLRELALRREPAGIAFPPIETTQRIQEKLPAQQAILAFFTAQDKTFGFLVERNRYQVWEVGKRKKLHDEVAALLKSWHLVNGHRPLTPAEAADTDWKKKSGSLLPMLTAGGQTDFAVNLPAAELSIVPDGALWYLPFEALDCGLPDKSRPLITSTRVRYAPMASLVVAGLKPEAPIDQTTILLGKLTSHDDERTRAATLAGFEQAAQGIVGWKLPITEAAAVAATAAGRLVVLESLPLNGKNPLDWSPLGTNRGETETTLAEWLALPWTVPREVLLPGFHTPAEFALVRESGPPDGEELFLATMGMIGAGSRTIVLSRWRTGGETTIHELRELIQELPFASPADAWQRSLLLAMESQLEPERETRLTWKSREPAPLAQHPFFWAAPMLIDCGIPAAEAPEADPLQPQVARDPQR